MKSGKPVSGYKLESLEDLQINNVYVDPDEKQYVFLGNVGSLATIMWLEDLKPVETIFFFKNFRGDRWVRELSSLEKELM